MALIPLADYAASSEPRLRPLVDVASASDSSSAPRLRSLSEYAAMPVNRSPYAAPPAGAGPSLASRIAGLTGQAGSMLGRASPVVGDVANLVGGLMRVGTAVGGDGSTAERIASGVSGATQLYSGAAGALNRGVGTALPALPWYIGPAVEIAGAGAGAKSVGEGAARAGLAAMQQAPAIAAGLAGGSAMAAQVAPFMQMFGPMFAGFGKEIGRAFTDVPHAVREQAETQRALGQGETMMDEVGTATTPEQLWAALNRGVGTYGVPLDARYRTVDDLLADPATYSAAIQAGINPDFIAGTNAQLTQTVQQTAALMNAARTGDPQAQAILAARGPQREGYLAKAIALMSGPTMYGRNDEGGGGNFTTGGGGAPPRATAVRRSRAAAA